MTDHIPDVSKMVHELAARIERADGPDRALDAEIALAAGWQCLRPRTRTKHGMWLAPGKHPDDGCMKDPPAFTGLIDAAKQLVPKGLVFNVGNDTAFCWAHVWDDTPDYDGEPFEGHACTLPQAICAAALRAQVQP